MTSSSLEVMAAMSLTDEEFDAKMVVKDNKPPAFYSDYVEEVQRIIENNAKMEFECLWRHKQQTGEWEVSPSEQRSETAGRHSECRASRVKKRTASVALSFLSTLCSMLDFDAWFDACC